MKSTKLTRLLIFAVVCVGVCLIPVLSGGTATRIDETTFEMTADNDSLLAFASSIPYGTRVVAVKVNCSGTSKTYELRKTSQSGSVLYMARSNSVTSVSLAADPVRFTIPADGALYFNTDDSDTTNVRITIYTGNY